MKKYYLILFIFFPLTESAASIKSNIIKNLQNINNISFDFEQNINGKIEDGNCIIEYPKKIFCKYNLSNNNVHSDILGQAYEYLIKHFADLVNKKAVGIHLVPVAICETSEEIDVMYGEYTTAGYEGQMIRQDAVYKNKRSKGLLKRKCFT